MFSAASCFAGGQGRDGRCGHPGTAGFGRQASVAGTAQLQACERKNDRLRAWAWIEETCGLRPGGGRLGSSRPASPRASVDLLRPTYLFIFPTPRQPPVRAELQLALPARPPTRPPAERPGKRPHRQPEVYGGLRRKGAAYHGLRRWVVSDGAFWVGFGWGGSWGRPCAARSSTGPRWDNSEGLWRATASAGVWCGGVGWCIWGGVWGGTPAEVGAAAVSAAMAPARGREGGRVRGWIRLDGDRVGGSLGQLRWLGGVLELDRM